MRHAVLIASLLLGSIDSLHADEAPPTDTALIARQHAEAIVKILVFLDQITADAKTLRTLAAAAYRRGSAIRASCLGPALVEADAAVNTAHQLSDAWQRSLRNEQFGLRTLTRLQTLAHLSERNATRGRACLDESQLARSLVAASPVQMDGSALLDSASAPPIERMGELRRPTIASPY